MANDVGLLQSSSPDPWAPVGLFDSATAPYGAKPTITSSTQRNGKVGIAYSTTLVASGDIPITWSVSAGTLPPGISLSGNQLVGTPTTVDTWTFWIRATNDFGADEKQYTFVVGSDDIAPAITTQALPDGRIGVPYNVQLRADGSVPIQWSMTGNPLSGIGLPAITSPGIIAGTPTAPGKPTFDIRVENTAGSDVESFSLLVPNEGIGGNAPVVTTVTLTPDPVSVRVGSSADLKATVKDQAGEPIRNLAGSAQVTGAAATATVVGVTDIDGAAVVRVVGVSSGAATVTATFDGVAASVSAAVVPVGSGPVIVTTTLPDGRTNTPYSAQLSATGTLPITWSMSAAVPFGISASGEVTGTAITAGTYTFVARATDANGGFTERSFSIVILSLVKKLSVTGLDSDSFGDTNVSGAVFEQPAAGRLFGALVGEFAGKTIDSTGALKVAASEFGGVALAVGTKVRVYMETADEFSPLFEAEIIEE